MTEGLSVCQGGREEAFRTADYVKCLGTPGCRLASNLVGQAAHEELPGAAQDERLASTNLRQVGED